MERFSQAYKTCRKVFDSGKFAEDWQKFLTKDAQVGSLLGRHGPNPKAAPGLEKLRKKILAIPDGQRGASPDASTMAMLRAWFADANTTDEQLKVAARKLLSGFKKIANVCNSNHLIFSDEPIDRSTDRPIDRSGGGWKDYAFVDPSETLNVVYAQGAFLTAGGATGCVWICVETIVHELSHRVAGTDDFAYDDTGLHASKTGITFSHAIRNADSWGYFCVDLAGMLAASDRTRVLGPGTLLKTG